MATDVADKDSLKEFTAREADALIRELQRRHPSAPPCPQAPRAKAAPGASGRATSEQQRKVWAMMYDIKAMDTEPAP